MPGKSQSHSDAVLNVLRGSALAGVTPYVGLFSVAPADDASAGRNWLATVMRAKPSRSALPRPTQATSGRCRTRPTFSLAPPSRTGRRLWRSACSTRLATATCSYWDALTTSKTVLNGDYGQFGVGTLVVKED